MLYLGKVFDSLTNKFQSFQKIKNIQRFRVFILSYRANSKEWKQRKIFISVANKSVGAIFLVLN